MTFSDERYDISRYGTENKEVCSGLYHLNLGNSFYKLPSIAKLSISSFDHFNIEKAFKNFCSFLCSFWFYFFLFCYQNCRCYLDKQ